MYKLNFAHYSLHKKKRVNLSCSLAASLEKQNLNIKFKKDGAPGFIYVSKYPFLKMFETVQLVLGPRRRTV